MLSWPVQEGRWDVSPGGPVLVSNGLERRGLVLLGGLSGRVLSYEPLTSQYSSPLFGLFFPWVGNLFVRCFSYLSLLSGFFGSRTRHLVVASAAAPSVFLIASLGAIVSPFGVSASFASLCGGTFYLLPCAGEVCSGRVAGPPVCREPAS